eukprot:9038010-Pyramimonas_sp.AAC.1
MPARQCGFSSTLLLRASSSSPSSSPQRFLRAALLGPVQRPRLGPASWIAPLTGPRCFEKEPRVVEPRVI